MSEEKKELILEQVNGGAREPKAIDIIGQAVAAEITAELAVRK